MEESTEAHMETDVSSTTEDVPETQEVTGSDGNVEMIIVVEKVKEEDVEMNSTVQSDKQLIQDEESINEASKTSKEPPLMDTETQKTRKSPIKEIEVSQSPSKTEPIQKVVNKNLLDSEIELSSNNKQTEDVDSSIKDPLPVEKMDKLKSVDNTPQKQKQSAENSPMTEVPVPIQTPQKQKQSAENSPMKEVPISIQTPQKQKQSAENSPMKEVPISIQTPQKQKQSAENSPMKEVPISIQTPQKQKQSAENSSIKEVPIPIQITPNKEVNNSSKSTPTKEPLIVEKFMTNGKVQSNNINDSCSKNISGIIPIDITIERETSNDSHLETISIETISSETSEKEHKNISRELKSLINSAKESKIISECTQLTTKMRKSRSALDSSNTSLNTSIEADKIQGVRRHSNNSQKSNCSEKSEKVAVKRSMRSQNPEFVSKVKQFLNSVTGRGQKESDDEDIDVEEVKDSKNVSKEKIKPSDSLSTATSPKVKKIEPIVLEKTGKLRSDSYCWRCHWAVETNEKVHSPMACTVCPRSFHFKCLTSTERSKINTDKSWVCPECMLVLQAESSETRSQAMKKISLGMLCELLKHALERMMDLNGVEPFMQSVDRSLFPDYDKYVVHPMDLSLMRNNITEQLYGSTEAFLADAQWILHNSIIFNTLQSKLTAGARALVRSCRAEMGEIEACPECYAAAHARKPTWFTDVCTTPHILLWAKLKGFPYWPAKGMSVSGAGHVDVRFFGAHDRAWVPAKDCFLYSEKDPNNFRTKRQDIIDSMQEAEQHIRNISRKYGKFVYPPFKTQFDPSKLSEQLKMMIPTFEGEVRSPIMKDKSNASPAVKDKSRSNSKSSKSSCNDGDISESEDAHENVASRKMADGAEIARMDEDSNADKPETMDVDTTTQANEPPAQISKGSEPTPQSNKTSESSRKRRRSVLEEAVITIMDSSNNPPEPKKKKNDNKVEKEKKKIEKQEPSNSKETEHKLVEKSKKNVPSDEVKKEETTDKNNEPSNSARADSDNEKNQRVTPIRIALVQKERKHNLRTSTVKEAMGKIITPTKDKDKESEKTTPQRQKSFRSEKSSERTPKEDKVSKAEKRRNSRSNRSLSGTPKVDKARRISIEKKSDKTAEAIPNKEKVKENKEKTKETTIKEKDSEAEKSVKDKLSSPKPNADNAKNVKDRLQFDDDTSLAIIARESKTVVIPNNTSGLPTISCVRSLSTIAQNTATTNTKITTSGNSTDITIEVSSNASIFTPTSSESVKNMKDATTKLQKLRNNTEPMVGRVGVRAFARMTSPEKSPKRNDNVQVEIKAEPIDVDDADRQMEKLNLMNAFKLRPVQPPTTASNLREVRINKVLVTPLNAKKTGAKTVEIRPRAKKTFPQPKKPEDGQLNSKNSMVYIPIQPPMTQAPVRTSRVIAGPTGHPPMSKSSMPASTATNITNSLVNTVTTPIMQVSAIPTTSSTPVTTSSTLSLPTLGQVNAAVHTVPLMTSVNGQWMFSFQPVMSVGAIENSPSPPILNGVSERGNNSASIIPLTGGTSVNNANVGSGSTSAPPTLHPPATRTPSDTHTPGEPPRLQQRPPTVLLNPLDASTPIGTMPTPSSAGPLTAKLNQNAVKLTDFFRTLLEDSLEKLEEPATQLTTARLQLEQAKWKHQAEIEEIKHNQELTMAEMRALFEKEKLRAVAEARRSAQAELEAAVKLAKSKQWCANCSQEAQFYCCWNTSYCDYPCQRAHWTQHFNVCAQQRQEGSNANEPPAPTENRLQPQPDNLPKSMCAPALTVGGKLAASRPYAQDALSNAQKNAIIVSMVEDQSGNQTMKCVGTYKAGAPAQNISPLILNKQIMSNEESTNKKVVSSGGYLIVGGGANSSAVVTPARRAHTLQYFS